MASQLDDETLEGDDKANDLPSEYVVKVNDMEFMRLRTAKSSQIAKLIKMDADLLVISRQDVQGFEARMQDFTGLTYQWEQKVIEAANIANEKGIELKKVTQEMLLLKKQLSSVTQDLAAALVNSKDKSLFPNEEGERLRMRLAEYESLFMTVVTSFEGQDFEEPTSVTQKVVEEREANIQMVENCLQEIEVLERARQKAVRHSLTVQTMFDVIHNQLMKEGDRSQTSRNQARHAWSEAVVLSMTGKPGPVASEPQEPDQEPQELQDLQEQEPEPIQLEQPQEPVVIDGKLHLSPAVESLFLKDQGVYVRRLNDLQNHLAEEMENTDILEEALNEAVEYGEELQMRLAGLQGELQTMIEDKQRLEEESQEQLKHHIQAQQHAASLQELARAEVARRDAQVAALQEALSAQEKQSAARMAQACQEMELMNQTLAAREESDAKARQEIDDLKQTLAAREESDAKARQEIDDLKQMLAAREESDAKALHEKDQQLKAVGEGAAQATEELRTKGQALHEKDQQVEAAHREMEELKQALREKDQQLEAVGEAAHREMEELKQALREKDQQLEAVGETAAQAMDELRTKGQADREVDELKRVLAAREESDAKALQEKHAEEESQEQLKHQMQIEAQQYAASLQELARAEVARRDAQVAALQEALFAQEKQSAASMAQARQEMELMNQALREKDQQLEAVGEAAAQAMDELRTKGQVDQQVEAAHREVDELKRVLAAREESDAKAHREIDELKRMLAARAEGVAQAFQERDQRVQDEPYEGPASFDISTPRSMKSPWADSPEEKRPDDAIVAENRQLHQRLSVAEEEKAIMMQNLRDHIKQLARENWDLKFKAGLIEDSTRSQSAKEAPLQESMNNPGTSSSSGSGSWLLSTILSPFLTDGDMREIHAESYVDQHLGANGQDQLP